MTTIETEREQPTGSNASLDEPTSSEGASSTEGERARVISAAVPEMMILPHQVTRYADNVFYGFTDNNVCKIDDAVGGFKSGELNKISDLLDGSNGLVQKCSLNDIMFLVMLMMTKSAADQRQSRYEDIAAKKVVAQKTADTVYELKMAEAKETYEAEKKAAVLQIVTGSMQVVTGFVSVVGGGVALFGELSTAFRGVANAITNFASDMIERTNWFLRIVGKIVKPLGSLMNKLANVASGKIFQTVAGVSRAVQLIANAASSTTTIVQGVVQIDIAKQQRKASFITTEASLNDALFNFNMQQLRYMQSAYSTSNRNIQNTISSIKEILQQNQSTRLSIARNI